MTCILLQFISSWLDRGAGWSPISVRGFLDPTTIDFGGGFILVQGNEWMNGLNRFVWSVNGHCQHIQLLSSAL